MKKIDQRFELLKIRMEGLCQTRRDLFSKSNLNEEKLSIINSDIDSLMSEIVKKEKKKD